MHEVSSIWDTVSLRQGTLELVALPGIGGRLWDIRLDDRSLLFQNPDLDGIAFDASRLDRLPTRSPQFGFPLWGGEKTWIAPESEWPNGAPHPVPDSGPYEVVSATDQALRMTSVTCPHSNLIVDREIALLSASSWTVTHRLANQGKAPRACGIWSVMMLDHPALIGVPGRSVKINKVFDEHGGRVTRRIEGAIANCDGKEQFKVAMDNPNGASLIRVTHDPIWLLCRTPAPSRDDVFAHGQPFEVFNSGDYPYCEAEWHSPQATLAPGDTLTFQQTFHVWRGEDQAAPIPLTEPERELLQCMS